MPCMEAGGAGGGRTFQPGNFTGWDSEGVKSRGHCETLLSLYISEYVIRPSHILFSAVCGCTFQPGNFTGVKGLKGLNNSERSVLQFTVS